MSGDLFLVDAEDSRENRANAHGCCSLGMVGLRSDVLLTGEDSAILLNAKMMIPGKHKRYCRKGQVQYGPAE